MTRSTTLQRFLFGSIAFVVIAGLYAAMGDPLKGALYGLVAGVFVFFLIKFIFRRNQDSFRNKVTRALNPYIDISTLTGYAYGFTGKGRSIEIMYFGIIGWYFDKIVNDPGRVFYYLGITPAVLIILKSGQGAPRIYKREEVKTMVYSGADLSENLLHIGLPDQTLDLLIEAGAGRTMTEAFVATWNGGKPVRDPGGKLI